MGREERVGWRREGGRERGMEGGWDRGTVWEDGRDRLGGGSDGWRMDEDGGRVGGREGG